MPVVKDKSGDSTDVNNYRGISVSSVVPKVLEMVLIERLRSSLGSNDQQFGFKRKHT